MSIEHIGQCGSGNLPADRDWIMTCYEMAICYLRGVLGEPPEGSALEIVWQEHELGDYPTLALVMDVGPGVFVDGAGRYVQRCEIALDQFNEWVSWEKLEPEAIRDAIRAAPHIEDED